MEATGTAVSTTPPMADETSLAAGLDQIEAAIAEAHNRLDEVLGSRSEDEAKDVETGARKAMFRCEAGLAELNSRLGRLQQLTGRL